MEPISAKLKDYSGGNPFRESQAKTYGDDKVVAEFYPTSFFWSLFNEQHEILLGTRGSGKTILLRMLTYSCIRRYGDPKARAIAAQKKFLAFYLPLHLEFVASLPGEEVKEADRILYFQLAFNCVAAKALLFQVSCLLEDIEDDPRLRLEREAVIVDHIVPMWFQQPEHAKSISSLKDLEWEVDRLFNTMDSLGSEKLRDLGQFSRKLMFPVLNILPRLTADLGLDPQATNWIVCIDEAEFLDLPFQRCINTFLRSEKRPLAVKMATLPFKHLTRETLVPEVSIEPNGNDFNYRIIDTPWDSEEFEQLCNHISRVRLSKCGLHVEGLTLETFLGKVGHSDDLIDYFRLELPGEATDERIMAGIQAAVSPRRRKRLESLPDEKSARDKPYIDKFSPVLFMRRMREEDTKGARSVGWFAGAKVIRRISDGNPRRFIQVMNALVDEARAASLTPKAQHRVMVDFCRGLLDESEALQRYGLVLRGLIDKIGMLLESRVHGDHMVNGGCGFRIHQDLADDEMVAGALKLAVDFLHMRVDDSSLNCGRITETSDLRLCFVYGVVYWLPMRTGDPVVLRNRTPLLIKPGVPLTRRAAAHTLGQIQLELVDGAGE
jgi:hypothetical protein